MNWYLISVVLTIVAISLILIKNGVYPEELDVKIFGILRLYIRSKEKRRLDNKRTKSPQ